MTQLEYNDVVIISYWMSEIYSVYLLVFEETGYQQELFYMHVCIDRTTHSVTFDIAVMGDILEKSQSKNGFC